MGATLPLILFGFLVLVTVAIAAAIKVLMAAIALLMRLVVMWLAGIVLLMLVMSVTVHGRSASPAAAAVHRPRLVALLPILPVGIGL